MRIFHFALPFERREFLHERRLVTHLPSKKLRTATHYFGRDHCCINYISDCTAFVFKKHKVIGRIACVLFRANPGGRSFPYPPTELTPGEQEAMTREPGDSNFNKWQPF